MEETGHIWVKVEVEAAVRQPGSTWILLVV
jgi:hypothetical protein